MNKPEYKSITKRLKKMGIKKDLFQETEIYLAFPTEEAQNEVLDNFFLESSIRYKAKKIIENESKKVTPEIDVKNDEEIKSEIIEESFGDKVRAINTNRGYFSSTTSNFNRIVIPVEELMPCPEHILHYDRALLLKDIIGRLKLLKQYDDALGCTSITNTRVYDVIDCDSAEEFEIMKAYLNIENDDYGKMPNVDDMFDRDHEAIIAECDEILEKYKQKDRFDW